MIIILGVEFWSENFATCGGKRQSPIDIDSSLAVRESLPPLQLSPSYKEPLHGTLENNGHSGI